MACYLRRYKRWAKVRTWEEIDIISVEEMEVKAVCGRATRKV